MAIRDVVVTVRSVERLFCPYTGKHVEVHMLVQPGSIVFCAPAAFTLAEPVKGLDNLIRRSTMRDGVTGVVSNAEGMVDAYTGKKLRLRSLGDDMFCFVGGFNPRAACGSLEEFIYRFTMRDGKPHVDPPSEFAVETTVRAREPRQKSVDVSAETLAAAEKAAEASGMFESRTQVRVDRTPARRPRK